jgi:hypothetical protein
MKVIKSISLVLVLILAFSALISCKEEPDVTDVNVKNWPSSTEKPEKTHPAPATIEYSENTTTGTITWTAVPYTESYILYAKEIKYNSIFYTKTITLNELKFDTNYSTNHKVYTEISKTTVSSLFPSGTGGYMYGIKAISIDGISSSVKWPL